MSTPKPNSFYDGKGRYRLRKHGRAYTPALDQCPLTAHQRNIRRFQDLVVAYPHDNQLREDYWRQLAGPAPPDSRQPIEKVINDRLQAIAIEHRYSERVTLWARRITQFLYFVRWYR